jgi:hypothetical protein
LQDEAEASDMGESEMNTPSSPGSLRDFLVDGEEGASDASDAVSMDDAAAQFMSQDAFPDDEDEQLPSISNILAHESCCFLSSCWTIVP